MKSIFWVVLRRNRAYTLRFDSVICIMCNRILSSLRITMYSRSILLFLSVLVVGSNAAIGAHTVSERLVSPATKSPLVQRRSVSITSALPTHILRGHRSFVNDISFSGTTMASAGGDSVIILWDYRTGEIQQTLRGHKGYVYAVAFSPDGSVLASTGWDGAICLWNPTTGALLQTIPAHTSPAYDIGFSPDGSQLITASWDNTAIVRHVHTGEIIHTLQGHTGYVSSACFSPDGTLIASSSGDGSVKIWDVQTGQCLNTLQGEKNLHWFITRVCFSPDGEYIAASAAGNMNPVYVWTKHGVAVQTLKAHSNYATSVEFSKDGTRLTSASADNSLSFWNTDYFSLNERIKDSHYFLSHSFNGDGTVMAATALDGTITVWDVQSDTKSPMAKKGKSDIGISDMYSIQVVPNPASDFITISYSLPKSTFCSIELISQDGKQSAIIQKAEMPAGESTLRYETNHLPSGAYFIILSTSSKSLSHRVEIVK